MGANDGDWNRLNSEAQVHSGGLQHRGRTSMDTSDIIWDDMV